MFTVHLEVKFEIGRNFRGFILPLHPHLKGFLLKSKGFVIYSVYVCPFVCIYTCVCLQQSPVWVIMCAHSYAFTHMHAYTGVSHVDYMCAHLCSFTCTHAYTGVPCGSYVLPFVCVYTHPCLHWSSVWVRTHSQGHVLWFVRLWNSDTWRNWIDTWKVKGLSGKISTE